MVDERKPIIFKFSEQSYALLKKIQGECNYDKPAFVIRDALHLYGLIRDQAKDGFYKIILQNPKTGDTREVESAQLELLLTTYFLQK